MSPLVFTHFKCVYEARQNKLPKKKIPSKLCWEHLAFCAHRGGHLFPFPRHLDPCVSGKVCDNVTKKQPAASRSRNEMFSRERRCPSCPRCRHFYKSEFRFHSSLAHFIICIFLLYRLNIFYVNSWLPPPPPVNSIEAPNSWWWINCSPSPRLRIFCGLNAYFLKPELICTLYFAV